MKRTTACFLAAMTVLAMATHAADIFVAPEGRGAQTGANWSNALNGSRDGFHIDVKNAITAAVADGATEVNVYFAGGTYAVTNQLALGSITIPVKLSGGYLAETDGSLDKGETATIFSRTANYVRHLYASSMSELYLEGITFEKGYLTNTAAQRGGSVYLTSCETTITNCTFLTNRAHSKSNTSTYGGAIYANAGSLTVRQSTFNGNYTTGSNCIDYGGAICALNANLTVEGSVFSQNYCNSTQKPTFGGAIAANEGTVIIRSSKFTKNYVYCSQNIGTSFPIGGAISVRSANRFEMSDCTLENNAGYYGQYPALKSGFYLDDTYEADGVMTSVVTRCVFDSRSLPTTYKTSKSNIILNGGCLFMTNCLISGASGTDSTMTNSISVLRTGSSNLKDLVHTSNYTPVSVASMELVNCTIAGGKGVGAVAMPSATGLTLKNCIVYGNTVAGVINPTSVTYSCIQEPHDGVGNFVADPHWTGAPYYHLLTKRAGGAITDGWFGGTYNSPKTEKNSPCLDAGAPDSVGLDLEPFPNGRHVNLGAYGGTPWATKTLSPPGTTVFVQ